MRVENSVSSKQNFAGVHIKPSAIRELAGKKNLIEKFVEARNALDKTENWDLVVGSYPNGQLYTEFLGKAGIYRGKVYGTAVMPIKQEESVVKAYTSGTHHDIDEDIVLDLKFINAQRAKEVYEKLSSMQSKVNDSAMATGKISSDLTLENGIETVKILEESSKNKGLLANKNESINFADSVSVHIDRLISGLNWKG